MAFDDHVRRGQPITFAVLAFFAFVQMIQTAVIVSSYNRHNSYPSRSIRDQTRFLVFASVWTLVFSAFYIYGFLSATLSFLFSIASHSVWLFITWLFWLAGAAAITNSLGGGLNCNDLPEGFGHCGLLNSIEGFSWVLFLISTFAFIVVVIIGARSARRGDGFGGALVV